jgi:hypothetical protein
MTTIATPNEVAELAASAVRLTVDASHYTVADLEMIASSMSEKTYMDITGSDALSKQDRDSITRSAGGQIIFC